MKHLHMSAGALLLLLFAGACSKRAEGGGGGYGGFGGGGGEGTGGAGGASLDMPLAVSAVAVGAAHTCAIVAGGAVACWGSGSRGQLGDGLAGQDHARAYPALVPGLTGVTGLRAGGDTTCALASGGVTCWGDGAFGQLGDGLATDGHYAATPVTAVGLTGVVDLSVTGQNACAVLTGGAVRCWGRNASDAWLGFVSADCGPYTVSTGDGGPMLLPIPCEPTPRDVPSAHDALSVVSGGAHSCLRTADGHVSCWGADHFGQLGDGLSGPDAFRADAVEVTGLLGAERLALGASHTCAVSGDTLGVRCWGDNAYGQLGIGTNALDSYKLAPTDVDLTGVADLHAAGRTTCAARSDGSVLCWGATATMLPVSPEKDGSALVPTLVPGLAGVVEVRTGGAHGCGRLGDGTLVCWGENDRGQLGNGTMGLPDFSMDPVVAVQDTPG
jgi:alpha-tubulin suppressor-like RCC1 family protein